MTNLFWIQKYRQQIFALELLVAIIFGPALANILSGSVLLSLVMIAAVFLFLEITLAFTRVTFAKVAHENTKKIYDKTQAAHKKIKQDYQELSGERLDKYRTTGQAPKKKRKPKPKKTHRK